ncbi:MAG: hypothetical protein KGP10_09405 [Actinomycetales bacterium]|nr:hypothetical protein [Actinomycetales bacterium]
MIPPLRWGSLRRLLPLLGSVMLTVLGLLWLARFPVMQDDLQILTNGVAAIRADGVAHHFTANLITSVGPAHIVPFVTVPGTLHQLAATAAIALGVDPTVAWSMLRITWVVLALLAAAFFVTGWQQAGRTNRWGFTATYAGVAAVLLATVQVHVLWSNDPTVSYPIAGWAGCCAGFTLLGVVGRVLTGRLTLPIGAVLSGLLAILCLGTYELLAGFVVTGVLGVVLTRGAATARSRGWLTLALAAPLGMFAVGQVWRLTQPAVYSGTQPGEAGAVLPTAVWGVLSALPLTAAVPLDRIVGLRVPEPVGIASAAITVVMVMGLCAVWLRRRTPPRVSGPADDRVPGAPGGVAHLPPVSVLAAAAWVGCTLIIALSARYQQELGYLGAVYTFYAAGALAVAVIVVRGVQWLVEQGWASVARPATVAVVAATGLLTGMLNAVSADAIDGNWSFRYGREMLTALDTHPLPYRERCVIAQRWWLTPFPEYYRAEVLADAQRAFLAQHDTPMCAPADIFDGLAGTLSAVGATHGFEHDGQVGFQWLSPGRARLTVAPTPLTTAPTRVWLALDLPPCASRQRVRLVSPVRDRAQVFALPARVPLWVRPASVTEVDVETLAGGCQVPGDTRTLAARVSLAGAP